MSLVLRVLPLLMVVAPAAADVTDRVARTVPLEPDTPVTVELTVGRIDVTGWDRPEVSLEVVRRAPDAARLARLPLEVELASGGLVVRAVQREGGRDAALRADVVLRLPAAARIAHLGVFEGAITVSRLSGRCSARIERGPITARHISGELRFETVIGDIDLQHATLVAGGMMRLRTFNGDVNVHLTEPPAHARIMALSLSGTITSDLPLTRRERWGPRWAEATIGSGEPLLSIDVVTGHVAVRVVR